MKSCIDKMKERRTKQHRLWYGRAYAILDTLLNGDEADMVITAGVKDLEGDDANDVRQVIHLEHMRFRDLANVLEAPPVARRNR
ncbi:MAG: hypothetical protein WC986_14675 [Elusimicrobiota bacterium]|jgi:hypothetical protein